MTEPLWNAIRETFYEILQLPPADREGRLAQIAKSNPECAAEVQSLLDAQRDGGEFVDAVIGSGFHSLLQQSQSQDLIGNNLGPYRVEEVIGEGGSGLVYRGVRQDGEYQQDVAIKVLKKGLDTEAVLRRFAREKQILAQLNHPRIARILDGGHTPQGLPYFVLEYQQGTRIDKHCSDNSLNLRQRVELFLRVCESVQFAHQNLVVHQDLKPANILVDGLGEPHLLDFGIARVLQPESDALEFTDPVGQPLSPAYASPEQVRASRVTTATDIYSLGVLLYELLTSCRPYHFHSPSTDEVRRVITEVEPPLASVAVRRRLDSEGDKEGSGEGLPSPMNSSDPRTLIRKLQGDLDAILSRALAKDPAERYPTIEALREDLLRHLDGRPVLAKTPTTRYLMRKFVVRHHVAVTASLVVLVVLTVSLGALGRFYWKSEQASRGRELASKMAQQRFDDLHQLVHTLLFDVDQALQATPGTMATRELLVTDALRYLNSLAGAASVGSRDRTLVGDIGALAHTEDPTVQLELASAFMRIADIQGSPTLPNLGEYDAALTHYTRAIAILDELLAERHPKAALNLASAHLRRGALLAERGKHADAEAGYIIADELLAICPDSRRQRRLRATLNYRRADDLARSGHFEAAAQAFQGALDLFQSLPEEEREGTETSQAAAFLGMGRIAVRRGDNEQGAEHYREALELSRRLIEKNPRHPKYRRDRAIMFSLLSRALADHQDYAAALPAILETIRINEELQREDAADSSVQLALARSYKTLGQIETKLRRRENALESYGKSVKLFELELERHPESFDVALGLFTVHGEVAICHNEAENYELALDALEQAFLCGGRMKADFPEEDCGGHLAFAHRQASESHLKLSDLESAQSHALQALEYHQQSYSSNPKSVRALCHVSASQNKLADILWELDKKESAIETLEAGSDLLESWQGPQNALYRQYAIPFRDSLAARYKKVLRWDLAEAEFRKAMQLEQAHYDASPDHPRRRFRLTYQRFRLAYFLTQKTATLSPTHARSLWQEALDEFRRCRQEHNFLNEKKLLVGAVATHNQHLERLISRCEEELSEGSQ